MKKKRKMIIHKLISIAFILIYFTMNAQINPDTHIISLPLDENKTIPNNGRLPVMIYKNVFLFDDSDPAALIERFFSGNNWGGSWRNGIFPYHHYHTTAHEALGVYAGWAEVQLGGEGNDPMRIEKGDLVILPAGTGHKKIDSGEGFAVVGAYPDGQSYDMNYGKPEEMEDAKKNIAKLALPTQDPVFGKDGKLFSYWK